MEYESITHEAESVDNESISYILNELSMNEGPEGDYQSHFPVHFFSKSHFAILKCHSNF